MRKKKKRKKKEKKKNIICVISLLSINHFIYKGIYHLHEVKCFEYLCWATVQGPIQEDFTTKIQDF